MIHQNTSSNKSSNPLYQSGFYRVVYDFDNDSGLPERHIDATHFQMTDARLVFPCFDQPDMKGNIICVLYGMIP